MSESLTGSLRGSTVFLCLPSASATCINHLLHLPCLAVCLLACLSACLPVCYQRTNLCSCSVSDNQRLRQVLGKSLLWNICDEADRRVQLDDDGNSIENTIEIPAKVFTNLFQKTVDCAQCSGVHELLRSMAARILRSNSPDYAAVRQNISPRSAFP